MTGYGAVQLRRASIAESNNTIDVRLPTARCRSHSVPMMNDVPSKPIADDPIESTTSQNVLGIHTAIIDDALDTAQYTMDDIRRAAVHIAASDDVLAMRIRAICWRILLGVVPISKAEWTSSASAHRDQYSSWKREFLTRRRKQKPVREPHDDSPTSIATITDDKYQRDESLIKEIQKDVSRTQSSLPFFAIGGMAQQWMLRILFVYAKLHPEIGYMQGMNEILAPILYLFGTDSDETWAAHAESDAFVAFTTVMASAKLLYTKSPTQPSKNGVELQMDRLTILLRQHDALLWQHLNSIGLTPDLYSFRWYMTLLAREFPITTTMRIWDALLADSKRFSLLHYINCALIRSQRSQLLREGFTTCLKRLQTLPSVDIDRVLVQAEQMRGKDRQIDHQRQRTS